MSPVWAVVAVMAGAWCLAVVGALAAAAYLLDNDGGGEGSGGGVMWLSGPDGDYWPHPEAPAVSAAARSDSTTGAARETPTPPGHLRPVSVPYPVDAEHPPVDFDG